MHGRGEVSDGPQTAQGQALASSFRMPVITSSNVISFAYQKSYHSCWSNWNTADFQLS